MRELQAGEELAGYRIESVLGQGGMGTVYEAIQLSLDRRVALKILSADLASNPEFKQRFRREALIQASLAHPHTVAVHDAGEINGTPYIVMRLIRGSTLRELLDAGRMPPEQLLHLLGQVADALDTAHAQQLVHRDVKPQNILVRSGTKAYLADFGLTRLATQAGLTTAGQFVGTVRYIAPEQITGRVPTGAADTYSLTAVLYEGLTGQAPYLRDTDVSVLYAHLNDPPPRVTELVPDLPPGIDAVVARGMSKDPERRFPTAVELIEAAWPALGLTPATTWGLTPLSQPPLP